MATYVVKVKPPSLEEWRLWVQMGYLGSYEQYAAEASKATGSRMFINGDLGPHCTECAAPSENLCDYPVGDGKTCDRSLCDEHSKGVAADTHYCRDHWLMWMDYLASERGYEVLNNVTPLGVVTPLPRPVDRQKDSFHRWWELADRAKRVHHGNSESSARD